MIQLENVHKSYGQTKVLKGIDLQIQDQDDRVNFIFHKSYPFPFNATFLTSFIRRIKRNWYPFS